ncbi:hypothetical protein MNBD_GAMMA20-250 [hydrothermal vent metagenome]|uniref:Cytochrome c n=1 Tax=hydrothermal vent metagenome TaxID=652676 RepID=A0A3B1AHL1_9ZZZZ
MCKMCWASVVVLLLAVLGMGYKFILSGEVVATADGREAIVLEPAERDMVLSEMREFLVSIQAITEGIVNNDMPSVVTAARAMGTSAQRSVPGSLIRKLPLGFKTMGFDTHTQFEQLALDAEQLGDSEHALGQLAELMQNCTVCHTMYRFETPASLQETQ